MRLDEILSNLDTIVSNPLYFDDISYYKGAFVFDIILSLLLEKYNISFNTSPVWTQCQISQT